MKTLDPSKHFSGIRHHKRMPFVKRCQEMIALARRRLAEDYQRDDVRALHELELRHWTTRLLKHLWKKQH